jgi:hypothetical protein
LLRINYVGAGAVNGSGHGFGTSARAKIIVAAPALVEAYAVLTRLPSPHRLSPQTSLSPPNRCLHEPSDEIFNEKTC